MKKQLEKCAWSQVLYANPVVLVSTRSPDGVDNVSPYGMVMPVSSSPPLMVIGVHPNRQTYGYIKNNREFAINLIGPAMKQACLDTAKALPAEESEFDFAGLTRVDASKIDVALVGESPANMECKLHWMKTAGDHSLVVGEVVAVWIDEEFHSTDSTEMRMKFDTLYHINDAFFRRGTVIDS